MLPVSFQPDAPSGGFDPSALISVGVGLAGNLIVASKDAKERRKMEDRLSKLSLAQQKALAERLQNVQGDVAKMQIVYQALAVDKNRAALLDLNKSKYVGIAVLGGALVFLGIVILIAKNKNG